jgi:2-keto-4-pentenoate hydratase/2-oxohepta-3-ene-1,7-dioic acid hydratase in catechol pathway
MRLATLDDGSAVAIVGPVDAAELRAVRLATLGFDGGLAALVAAGDDAVARIAARLADAASEPLDPGRLAAPLARPGKIVAIGLNYVDHATEAGAAPPTEPIVFCKFGTSVTGPFDEIALPEDLSRQVDYEVELGVVIGRTARFVPHDRALEYVFGYTVLNDLSARDLQFADKQWVRSKSFDTFCPMGPVVVTRDEIADPGALRLGCDLNGRRLQDSTTAALIFDVPTLISRLSRSFTLEPGDVIATGTPAGVGFARQPPTFVRPGDLLETFVEGIGTLRNRAVARRPDAP